MWLDGDLAAWTDARQAVEDRCPAVLPFGAFEQHGPHLPLSTDTTMAAALARRVAEAVNGFLLPAQPFGETSSNDGFPGTVSLSFDTVRSIALDICTALRRAGFPCLIIVNGDFGNQSPLRTAARQAVGQMQWPVLVIDYPGLAEVAAEICESPPVDGIYHAEELETSVIMALRPGAVRHERMAAEYPALPVTFGASPIPLSKLSRSGVFGDPTPASPQKGERILADLAQRAISLAHDFLRDSGIRADGPG